MGRSVGQEQDFDDLQVTASAEPLRQQASKEQPRGLRPDLQRSRRVEVSEESGAATQEIQDQEYFIIDYEPLGRPYEQQQQRIERGGASLILLTTEYRK